MYLGMEKQSQSIPSNVYIENVKRGGKTCLKAKSVKKPAGQNMVKNVTAGTFGVTCQLIQGQQWARQINLNERRSDAVRRALRNPSKRICLSCGDARRSCLSCDARSPHRTPQQIR